MSARSLTVAGMARAVRQAREPESTDPPILPPNQMQLFSFYKPSLLATNYVVEVTQHIDSKVTTGTGLESIDVMNVNANSAGNVVGQEFEVMVPRFSLDPAIINSYYPPDGHQDEGRVLPHIVFNDPHYPWEIAPGITQNMDGHLDPCTTTIDGKEETVYRGMVPWVAMLVFDADELHINTGEEMVALNIPGFTTDDDVKKQKPDGIFTMKVPNYFNIPPSSRINYVAGYKDENDPDYLEIKKTSGAVNVIFPTKQLFRSLFAASDDLTNNHKTRLEALKYLAHVRNINTVGFPDAGIEQEGLFSIVVSSRTGPVTGQLPRTQICHLVSIEHVDSTLGTYLDQNSVSDRVAMISLYSWIYTALPPDPVNFVVMMKNLTTNMQMLRTEMTMLDSLKSAMVGDAGAKKTQIATIMHSRLSYGYTLARWRTQTGEETVAFNRGPLVPQPVTWEPPGNISDCSRTSQDYQILDPQTGLIDMSYSSAWQLGKLLAISDTVFSSALMRFRSLVHNSSAHKTRMQVNNMKTRLALLKSLQSSVPSLVSKSSGATGDPQRIRDTHDRAPAPGVNHPNIQPIMQTNIKNAVIRNASAGDDLYNEFNLDGPNNNDWAIILSWMCEKLSLGGIPPQYLIPEPAYLPVESLRFFYIDDFWLDCLLDGALSVANHLDADDDLVRREIKEVFNTYLSSPVPGAGYSPQIPCYGFLIRSQLIKAMPDLKITVDWQGLDDERQKVCRWTRWDDQTLMCLLDRPPEELSKITLAQPLHQSRFTLGSHVDTSTGVTFPLRRLYTQGAPPDASWPELKPRNLKTGAEDDTIPNAWYDPTSRCLLLEKMAQEIHCQLQFGKVTDVQAYLDPVPNSCELAMELSDKSYYFEIKPPSMRAIDKLTTPPPPDTRVFKQRLRQLYVRTPQATQVGLTLSDVSAKSKTITTSQPLLSKPALASQPIPSQSLSSKPSRILHQSTPTAPHAQANIQPRPVASLVRVREAGANTRLSRHFNLAVFPDYKGPPKVTHDATDYIPYGNYYYYDLIFDIRKNIGAGSQSKWPLLKITIDIPTMTDPPITKPTEEALLTSNYDGPGLRMLSNQRFVPFLFHDDEPGAKGQGTMTIELIPRSTNDSFPMPINDNRTLELSFRLAEANISPVVLTTPVEIVGDKGPRTPVGKVKITMTEWYQTDAFPSGEPVSNFIFVYKTAPAEPDDTL